MEQGTQKKKFDGNERFPINHYDELKTLVPKVGMGVTKYLWTDYHAYEVIDVKDDRHITVRRLDSKRTDNNGMSDCQDYEFYSNENNSKTTLYKPDPNKAEWVEKFGKRIVSRRWRVGFAKEYYDYSF